MKDGGGGCSDIGTMEHTCMIKQGWFGVGVGGYKTGITQKHIGSPVSAGDSLVCKKKKGKKVASFSTKHRKFFNYTILSHKT